MPIIIVKTILSMVVLGTLVWCDKPDLLKVSVMGIFKINSTSENAFIHAVHLHNQKTNKKFKLESSLALLPTFESLAVINKVCQKLSEENVVAIFGGNLPFVSQDVGDLARTLNLPLFIAQEQSPDLIALTSPRTKPGSVGDYLLQLRPPVNNPLVEYLIQQKWRTFSYICSSGQCLYRLQKLTERITTKDDKLKLNIDVRYVSDARLASKDLRNLNKYLDSLTNSKRILIDMDNKEDLQLLLHKIVQMGMNRPGFDYIITTLEIEDLDLDDFRYSGVNITGFRIINKDNERFRSFSKSWNEWNFQSNVTKKGSLTQAALMYDAVELFVETLEKLMENNDVKRSFVKPTHLNCYSLRTPDKRKIFEYQSGTNEVLGSSVRRRILQTIMEGPNKPGLTGDVAFNRLGSRADFMMTFLAMEVDKGMVSIGRWTQKSGLNVTISNGDRITSRRLLKQPLRVVTIINPPFTQLRGQNKGEVLKGNDRFEGFCIDLLNLIAEMLNFKYTIHLVSDFRFGNKIRTYHNGTETWSGMIGELLNGTADMVLAPLTISVARAKVVYFSEPFLTFGISLMIKKPDRESPGIFSFMSPLANEVWASYFAACVIVSCGLFVIARLSPYEWTLIEGNDQSATWRQNFNLYNSVWYVFAALVRKGVVLAPKSLAARILSSVWWFFTLIMTVYYIANMISLANVSTMITPIKDFADLLKPGMKIEYGTLNSSSTKNFFLTTNLSPFYEMGNVMKTKPHVFTNTIRAGVDRVISSKGKYAFILESPENEFVNNRVPCKTMMVGRPFGNKGYGIATSNNFPMKEEINYAVIKLRESQQINQLYNKWWIKKGECKEGTTIYNKPLTFADFAGLFYILAAVLILALILSLLEFSYNYCRKYRKSHATASQHDPAGSKKMSL